MLFKKFFPFVFFLFFSVFSSSNLLFAQEVNPSDTLTWVQKVEKWYEVNMNYGSITALMTIESSFVPFPSEIVIPPAAYVASKPESDLNIFLVVLFGTLGALLGAYINYFLALWLGRPIIYKLADSKFGKLMLLSSEKVQKAEAYFNKHGKVSTFVGRLIPGIRQLISLPAGLAKMNFLSFTTYTFIGAGIWNAILALLGYLVHGQADLIDKYSHELGMIILGLLILAIIYLVGKYFWKKKKSSSD
ncbi:MAG TPA: DedA family protein [Bacteroidales bacterium]|nr:DedA family protein [Bacteroidales bacterium]